MRSFSAPFIVGMRQVLQVSEASRHEASFETVLPPIGAVAPVTSVPDESYAGFSGKLFYQAVLNKRTVPQNDIRGEKNAPPFV